MAGLDGKLSGVHRDVAEPSRAGIADRRIDSLRSGRRQRDPQSTRHVLGDSDADSEIFARINVLPMKEAYKSRVPTRRARLQALLPEAFAKGWKRPSLARSTRVTSQISGHDKRHRESQRHHRTQSLEKRQAVEESFHDSPMDRSRRRHGGEKVSPYQRLSPYGRSRSRA